MTPHAGDVLCTEVVPRIRAAIPASTRMIGAEDASELIQDTIAHRRRFVAPGRGSREKGRREHRGVLCR